MNRIETDSLFTPPFTMERDPGEKKEELVLEPEQSFVDDPLELLAKKVKEAQQGRERNEQAIGHLIIACKHSLEHQDGLLKETQQLLQQVKEEGHQLKQRKTELKTQRDQLQRDNQKLKDQPLNLEEQAQTNKRLREECERREKLQQSNEELALQIEEKRRKLSQQPRLKSTCLSIRQQLLPVNRQNES